ncbi:hypothetical protein [Brevundimonas diminuta]|uniref:hypothetical protein n=1 Tax=Brevundimonas diminuta TaxID=293 RepID=UPI003D9A216F
MLTPLLFSLVLSSSAATPVHARSAGAMPVAYPVRDRSAPRPGEEVREECRRGQPTGSNIRQDICRQASVKRSIERAARR